ncbi:MAG TPA: hypothetical protein VF571_09100 [Pyrinomonadaceae bacterium]|jgi:hypothetical protein
MKRSTLFLLLTIPILFIIAGLWLYSNYRSTPSIVLDGREWTEASGVVNGAEIKGKLDYISITKELTDTGKFIPPNKKLILSADQPFELDINGNVNESRIDEKGGDFFIVQRATIKRFNPKYFSQVDETGGKILLKLSDKATKRESIVKMVMLDIDNEELRAIRESKSIDEILWREIIVFCIALGAALLLLFLLSKVPDLLEKRR